MTAPASRQGIERERILDAALGLVFTRGLRRTRMAELARKLGVVPSALHYHFAGGKDELIAVVFDREETRLLAAMDDAVAGSDNARGRLLALAGARLKYAARLGRLYPIDESIGDEIQAFVMQRRQRFLKRERQRIGRILRDAIGRGESSEKAIDLLAAAFQGALFNVTRTYALAPNSRSQAILGEVVDLLFRGVKGCR
ncbi:MAG: TetR/AcrR family transcriptional regulator [Vicinamibacteria bacterium]|nr:TetR/AcrR family transcriptional regulator [Vicinamibacteria bacterium]